MVNNELICPVCEMTTNEGKNCENKECFLSNKHFSIYPDKVLYGRAPLTEEAINKFREDMKIVLKAEYVIYQLKDHVNGSASNKPNYRLYEVGRYNSETEAVLHLKRTARDGHFIKSIILKTYTGCY